MTQINSNEDQCTCSECMPIEQYEPEPFSSNEILLVTEGAITANTFARFISELKTIESQNPSVINVTMLSGGGDISASVAIYDAIKACPIPITIKAYGTCMSGAMLILQAAKMRISSQNCNFMTHYGTMQYQGNALDFQKWGRESERMCEAMAEMLAKRIKGKDKLKRVRKMMETDTILSAQEALKLGLIDRIE